MKRAIVMMRSPRYATLALATIAAMAAQALTIAPTFLMPTWMHQGMGLAQAGGLASAPALGMMLSLVPWGWVIEKHGERVSLVTGLTVAASAYAVASCVAEYRQLWLLLVLGGAAAASVNTASGRLVAGQFASSQRGRAMGVRQAAQPLGVALAAALLPSLADSFGPERALLMPAFLCGSVGCLCLPFRRDLERQFPGKDAPQQRNPYSDGSGYLLRIHVSSILLTVPQALTWTFMFTWLRLDQGWATVDASLLVIAAQLLSALGRVAAGHWSDTTGSRTAPIRQIAILVAVCLVILAGFNAAELKLAVPCFVALAIFSVVDNGLAFTAIVEYAGTRYSGRALGIQNTGQLLMASLSGPVFGAVIAEAGYPTMFVTTALAPLVAVLTIPRCLATSRNFALESPRHHRQGGT
jgi:MFS family permease